MTEDFNLDEKVRILSILKEMFPESDDKTIPNYPFYISDWSNVLAIYPRSKRAKDILKYFGDKKKRNINWEYNNAEIGSFYTTEYINDIISFFNKINDEKIKIITAKDIPIKIIGEDFGFLLAPRTDY